MTLVSTVPDKYASLVTKADITEKMHRSCLRLNSFNKEIEISCDVVSVEREKLLANHIKTRSNDSNFNGLTLRAETHRSNESHAFDPNLVTYLVDIIIIVTEGPDAAMKLRKGATALKKWLQENKITYREKSNEDA